MKARFNACWLACLLLAVFVLAPGQAAYADYDQDAEIQRLIDLAKEQKAKAASDKAMLEAKRDKLKATFLELNTTQKQISDLLYKVRMTDARNKAMMTIKTGLLIKTAIDAPRSLTATVTDIFVMVGSDYLQNNYPELFDTQAHQLTASFAADGIKAVEKLNWIISLDDQAMSGMIRSETPELARDRGALSDLFTAGKLSDDLISLKRAEYIIKAGTEAEKALDAAKQELLKKQSAILTVIGKLEQEVKRREEDIHSWERHREIDHSLRQIPPIPKAQPVSYSSGSMDFAAAAGQMRNALTQLKANKIDCNGYSTTVLNAEWGAHMYLSQLWLQQVAPPCQENRASSACVTAIQRFDAGVRQSYNTQINGTNAWLAEQFANEKPRVMAFLARLQHWQKQTITIPSFGNLETTQFEVGSGTDVARAVWHNSEIALPESYLDEYWSEMQLPLGAPPRLEAINKTWAIANAHVRDLDHDMALAGRADAQARAAAADADSLAREWEPNFFFWSCHGVFSDWELRYLKQFKPAYDVKAASGQTDARRYVEAAKTRLNKLSSLASAYRVEASLVRTGNEAGQIRDKMFDLQTQGVGLSSPGLGYALWRMMTSTGVTEAMIKELTEVVPKLKNEEFALKYVLEIQASQNPAHKPVLASSTLTNLRDNLKRDAAFLVPIYNDYQSLYGQLRRKQAELDQGYRGLRSAVEGILGEPAEYIAVPLLLDQRYFIDANDFPDPSAGVFEQLDQYEKLALEYHDIMDPLHPASFHLVAPMQELIRQLERERSGLMGLGEAAFSQEINAFSSRASELAHKAYQAGGRLKAQALFNKAYSKLMALIAETGGAYTQGKKIAETSRQLVQLITGMNTFLARPDTEGGPGAALNWISAAEEMLNPASEASQLRPHAGIAGLLDQLTGLRDKLLAYQSSGGDTAIRKLYQDFAATYQARNLSGLLRFMTENWKTADGADLRDLEDNLDNSFRVFDRILFNIGGLTIRPGGSGLYHVSYTATITGHINQMNLKHQETAQVEDTVILTPEGPKIQGTRGGRLWLQQ